MPANVALFARYSNPTFVETGTWHGDGVHAALEAGFDHVYSIELSPELHQRACARFHGDSRMTLLEGPSEQRLPEVLARLDGPATFWLDAHYSSGDTALGEQFCPVLDELEAIARHPIKRHTLLIDDLRLFGPDGEFGVSVDALLAAIYAVNPEYRVTYEGDVVVAQP